MKTHMLLGNRIAAAVLAVPTTAFAKGPTSRWSRAPGSKGGSVTLRGIGGARERRETRRLAEQSGCSRRCSAPPATALSGRAPTVALGADVRAYPIRRRPSRPWSRWTSYPVRARGLGQPHATRPSRRSPPSRSPDSGPGPIRPARSAGLGGAAHGRARGSRRAAADRRALRAACGRGPAAPSCRPRQDDTPRSGPVDRTRRGRDDVIVAARQFVQGRRGSVWRLPASPGTRRSRSPARRSGPGCTRSRIRHRSSGSRPGPPANPRFGRARHTRTPDRCAPDEVNATVAKSELFTNRELWPVT